MFIKIMLIFLAIILKNIQHHKYNVFKENLR